MDETIARLDAPQELPAPAPDGELTDEELEFVVGGLTRPWVEPQLPWELGPLPR